MPMGLVLALEAKVVGNTRVVLHRIIPLVQLLCISRY
jgi:hypothetical protein